MVSVAPSTPLLQHDGIEIDDVLRGEAARAASRDTPRRRSVFFCASALLCCFVVVSACVGLYRHCTRGRELEPLLIALTHAGLCHTFGPPCTPHATTSKRRHDHPRAKETSQRCGDVQAPCVAELSKAASKDFDLHPAENLLFGFLTAQLARLPKTNDTAGDGGRQGSPHMAEILRGAHVRFPDPDAKWHQFLVTLPGAYPRISSHASTARQSGIDEGRVVHTILIGSLDGETWLQLEGSPWNPAKFEVLGHCLDGIEYVLTRKNVGPLGTSSYTDRNPLDLGQVQNASTACPLLC